MEYIIDKKNKKKAVLLSLDEFSAIEKQVEYYKNTIEELQDELDAIEADKIRKESKDTVKFQLNDYVSDRNRGIRSKNLKKTTRVNSGKNRKVYS